MDGGSSGRVCNPGEIERRVSLMFEKQKITVLKMKAMEENQNKRMTDDEYYP